jgi:transcriptional activator of cad operon
MKTSFRIGDWRVDPASGLIEREGETVQLDLRTMDLLVFLAENSGEVVSIDSLLERVWNGVAVTPDSVYQSVMSLRRLLGDDAKKPKYIATVPRRGYRLIAAVTSWNGTGSDPTQVQEMQPQETLSIAEQPHSRLAFSRRVAYLWTGATIVGLGLGIGIWYLSFHREATGPGQQSGLSSVAPLQTSVAVLPFQDLTEGMKQGEFTDGMTEELIDQLSNVPGLRIPSPTSSFYFKDKEIPLSELAGKLGVTYVLDGSVRKSGAQVRVAARLIRADTGYVIWSKTYDRPWHYTVMVQDEIAESLTKAVKSSLESTSSR